MKLQFINKIESSSHCLFTFVFLYLFKVAFNKLKTKLHFNSIIFVVISKICCLFWIVSLLILVEGGRVVNNSFLGYTMVYFQIFVLLNFTLFFWI